MLSVKKISMARSAFKHINRFRHIIIVMIKYGFGDALKIFKIDKYILTGLKISSRKKDKSLSSLPRPVRLRMAMEELGPTFVKIGQALSTRPDLMPVEYLDEISKLQDDAPKFSFEEVKKIIEAETGNNLGEIFSDIDEAPIAAASIGQVHKAILKGGEEVVVKVQRPGIKKIIETDLEILYQIASLIEKNIKEFELHRPSEVVDEFAKNLLKEIDFKREAANIRQFAEQYKDDEIIVVPKIYEEVSSSRILIMEFINGMKANDIQRLSDNGLSPKIIAKNGADLILKQVLEHGFFHADPHPGNIFILPGNRICFLDFGLVGRISKKERERFASLVMNVAIKDERKIVEAILKLTYFDENARIEELERDISEFIGMHLYKPLCEIEIGLLLKDLVDILTRNNLCLKPQYYMMMKALSSMDGLGRRLDPDFDIISAAEPFVQRMQFEKLKPDRIGEELVDYGDGLAKFIKDSPADIRAVIKQLKEGRLKIDTRHKGLDELIYMLNRISNKVAFAIILASVIIGSSLIILSGIPPKWGEIPIIGLIGWSGAGIMGLALLFSFISRKKF